MYNFPVKALMTLMPLVVARSIQSRVEDLLATIESDLFKVIMHKVFTDWLDVTYAPDDVPEPELRVLLLGCGFDLVREFGGTASYLAKPRGMVKVTYAYPLRAHIYLRWCSHCLARCWAAR